MGRTKNSKENTQTALNKREIKCRKWKGKQQEQIAPNGIENQASNTKNGRRMEDGKSDLCGCRPKEDLHAT